MKTSAGALLFAIITAFVLSMVAATLVILTTNQYRVINSEINRIRAYYRAQAGMEYTIYQSYANASWLPPANSNATYTSNVNYNVTIDGIPVNIRIVNPYPAGISTYNITLNTKYES